jgi:ribosome-binding protein aMBF1 (putative translation factor)
MRIDMSKKPRRIVSESRGRRLTADEAKRNRELREKVMREVPPAANPKLRPGREGIGARIREARQAQGLTWYAVAKRAGIPNPGTVRDIEYGRDARLRSVEAIARALGLQLDVVPVA